MALTPPQYKQMKQFLESDQRNKKFSLLQDDLEPGPLKDELLKDFDPSQETYEEYLRRKNLERPFNMAEGGRIGFRYGSIPEALNQLISEGKTNFESISALKNEIEKITGKRPGGSFQIYKYPLLEKFTFEKFKTKKKYKPEEYVVKDQKKLTKQIKKLNKKYKLNNKGINVKQILTSTGRPALEIQANAQVYGQVGRQAPPSIDGFNDIESELKKITKTDTFKNYDKSAAMKKGGEKAAAKMISPNKKPVFDYVLKNPNSTVDQITKALDLKKGVVTKTLQDLYVDMYKRLGDEGAVYFKQFDSKDIVSVADSIKNMNVDLKDRVKQLVTDAYKGDKNLKPLLKKISDFYSLQSEIKKTPYGKFFAGNLDHTIPLTFIRQLDEGADPMNLIRVKPMPEYLNQRAFKSQFDRVLGQAYATKNKKALEAIVNLQSYLPKEFGGITPDGKIKDYGAKPFSLKTNLSQTDFPEIYKRVFEFIENPELQETFKQSKVSFKKLLSQKKQIAAATKQFNKANLQRFAAIGCPGKMMGGRVKLAEGENLTRCAARGINKLQTTDPKNLTLADRANYQAIRKTSQGARLLKNVLGPAALGIEALFVAPFAAFDYASGRRGKDIALSALSLGLADQKLTRDELKEKFPEYGQAQKIIDLDNKLLDLESKLDTGSYRGRAQNRFLIEKLTKDFDNAVKKLPTEEAFLKNIRLSKQAEQDVQADREILKKQRRSSFDLSDPFSAAGGGIAKLAGVDSGPPPLAGPNSQGLQGLMKRGIKT